MKPNHTVFFLLIFVMVFLAGCGPSPEEIATMTASTWTATPEPTSTPLPTSTPTPIPYDLTFTVVDADGNPISGASVMLAELGEEDEKATQSSDENGQVSWGNLPEEMISLSVQGQGYFSGELSQTIERGANDNTFANYGEASGSLAE